MMVALTQTCFNPLIVYVCTQREENAASVKLQATWRGNNARKQYLEHQQQLQEQQQQQQQQQQEEVLFNSDFELNFNLISNRNPILTLTQTQS